MGRSNLPVMGRMLRDVLVAGVVAVLMTTPFASAALSPPATRTPAHLSLDDPERDCEEHVPAEYSVGPPLNDSPDDLAVRALVAADGVPRRAARTLLDRVSELYADLEIGLSYRVKKVSFEGDPSSDGTPAGDTNQLFSQLRDAVGGSRPSGIDVVHLVTNKRLFGWRDADGDGKADESERTYGAAGIAMCIGGVRWPETSFSMSYTPALEDAWDAEGTAITIAHEIGHLLGAQHHYANCAEGTAKGPEDGMVRPCTIMFAATYNVPPIHAMSDEWSDAEAIVIRGHADAYAGP